MKYILSLLISLVSFAAISQSNVVISEVYGGGGSATSPIKNDYVELYNPTNVDIDMVDWSVQYNSATGTNAYQFNAFSGKIKAKSYFLIQLGGGTAGADLPTPDVIGTLNLSATNGRVALVNNRTALLATSEANAAGIVDFVGFGTGNKWEGAAAVPTLSAAVSAERKANMMSTVASMSAGGADETAGNGYDSNNNNLDFVLTPPNPQNSASPSEGGTTATPSLIAGALAITLSTTTVGVTSDVATYTLRGVNLTGNITVSAPNPFSISKSASGTYASVLTFTPAELTQAQTIYVNFKPSQAISYDGVITNAGSGLSVLVSVTGRGIAVGNYSFDFNTCGTTLSDGFTAYSTSGAQVWSCTTFGRNATDATGKASAASGVQMNGFATTAMINEDWLISPKLAIESNTARTPILTFYSRVRFAGDPLQLLVSTNYSGSGDPQAAGVTWTSLSVPFPGVDSDTWTASPQISLAQYRGSNIYLAWKYVSDNSNAPRWTLDDVEIVSSSTPPLATLSATASAIGFDYVKESTSAIDSFIVNGLNLGVITTIATQSPFSVSTNGAAYSTSIAINNTPSTFNQKIYIRYSPTLVNKTNDGDVTVTNGTLTTKTKVSGNSYAYDGTFDVVNYNIEWFSGVNGPVDDLLQEQNALTLMKKIGADLFACTEIVDTLALKLLAEKVGSNTSEYGYFVSTYASGASTSISSTYADGQKLAYIYRKSIVKPISITPLFYTANTAEPAYNHWASGRFPYMLEADVTMNNSTKRINFILIHGKAQNSADAHSRRKLAATALKAYIDGNLQGKNVMILGDYNDDLDVTVGSLADVGADWPTSSYQIIVADTANYKALSLPLSQNGERSTASFGDVIDHAVVSAALNKFYINGTTQILNELANTIPNYASTTSDHYPLLTRFLIEPTTSNKELAIQGTLDIYPNPTNGLITINCSLDSGTLDVLDASGKRINRIEIKDNKSVYDTSGLANGIYFIQISGTTINKKIVKY